MMADTAERCAGRVWSGNWPSQCLRKGKILEGGKYWCATHAPSREKDRRAKQRAKWDEDAERQRKKGAAEEARDNIVVVAIGWADGLATPEALKNAVAKYCKAAEIMKAGE